MISPRPLVRPLVRDLHAYVPGEQPKIAGLIKLNTNENPYPPAPRVLKRIRAAVNASLRLYPNPSAEPLRRKLAALHGCDPENVIVGNGSDELLALAVRTFVEPAPTAGRKQRTSPSRATKVQYFTPSYSLYPVLAASHGALSCPVALAPSFDLPPFAALMREGCWDFEAALSLITTPNAPSGRGYSMKQLGALCRHQRGVIVLDEAYVDFAGEHALPLALQRPNVLVARTFSKAYSLCALRVGYFVGPSDLIAALHKMRDSYNVNALGQIAAEATLDCLPYYRDNFRCVIATRNYLTQRLTALGFQVLPSQTNFILTRPPVLPAEEWLSRLREHKILVRWFNQPEVKEYLRITVGTDAEANALHQSARSILDGVAASAVPLRRRPRAR